MQHNRTFRTIVIFPAIGLIVGVFATFMFLESILRFLPVNDGLYTAPVDEASPYPRFEPNRQVTWSKGWNFHMTNKNKVNNAGFVNDEDYDKPAESPLISVIGDSYVEALMIPHEQTLQGRLQTKFGKAVRVYSFARSGAPLSQYLNFAELATKEYASDFLIFVIVSNDFDESLAKYKSSPASHYFFGHVGQIPLELRRVDYRPQWYAPLIRHSSLAKYLLANLKLKHSLKKLFSTRRAYVSRIPKTVSKERLDDSRIAIDTFLSFLPTYSGLPPTRIIFIIDGLREQIYANGEHHFSESYFSKMRTYFMEQTRDQGYHIVDMNPIFKSEYLKNKVRFEFPHDWHWNSNAHQLAAMAVSQSRILKQVAAFKNAGL